LADFNPNAGTAGVGLITSSTPSIEYERGTPISMTKKRQATEAQLTEAYGRMSSILRKSLSQQLKDAGYDVPITGDYSSKVRDKFLQANRDLSTEITTLSINDPKRLETVAYDLTTFLKDKASDIAKSGTQGPSTTRSTNIFTDAEAIAEVQKLYRTLLNAEPTPEEASKLAKKLQNAQKKNPVVTKYKTVGGVQDTITTGGLDATEFLTNEIKKDPRYSKKQQETFATSKATLATTARNNGLDLNSNFSSQIDEWIKRIANGEDIKNIQNAIRSVARRSLPESVRNQIPEDEDLSVTFSPYINSIAKSKGVPTNQVSINEVLPLAVNDKGFTSISDFNKAKRKLAWWPETDEAIDAVYQGIGQIYSNFGIMEI
jgi:hypothetical protein